MGTETQPIRAAGTAVREQLCGQFDLTAARPIRRDSCAANPPGQLCGDSCAADPQGQQRGQSAGTAAWSIRRNSRGQSAGKAVRTICRESGAANPQGQPCGQSAGIAAPPIQRDSLLPIHRDSCAGGRGAANPGRRDSGAGTAVRPIRRDSSAANLPPGQLRGRSAGTAVWPIRRDSSAVTAVRSIRRGRGVVDLADVGWPGNASSYEPIWIQELEPSDGNSA
jgi:hypothetical protein